MIINPDPDVADYEIDVLATLAEDEILYVGIDVGKAEHMAGLVSKSLLDKYRRFDKCPVCAVPNSREGFEALLAAIQVYAPLSRVTVLKERTGHYGHAIGEYLQSNGVTCYTSQVYKRMLRNKTDKRDALNLAKTALEQLELGVQPSDAMKQICPESPLPEAARKLRPLVQRRAELSRDMTVRKNRLVAICDELFPEMSAIFKDVNNQGALNVRSKYPTPADVAKANLDELVACRVWTRPTRDSFAKLQELAENSIGVREPARVLGLVFEQAQLIAELRLLQNHMTALEAKIEQIAKDCREVKILQSFGFIGPVMAATIIATIGNILRFESASKFKGYCGWSPKQTQTGTSKDSMKLARGGNKLLKQAIYYSALLAIREDTELREKYNRLVARKCTVDLRTGKVIGKMKVFCRICGDICNIIFALLKKDHDLLQSLPSGATPPEPTLYDRELHAKHLKQRFGGQQPQESKVDEPVDSRQLTAIDRVYTLLEQNSGFKVSELRKLAECSQPTASQARKKWLEQHPPAAGPAIATTPERQRIVDALLEHGPMGLSALAERISKNPLTTRNHLVALRKEGRVVLGESNIYRLATAGE